MPKVKTLGLAAALFAAAVLVYSNSFKNGFCWDDHILIESNDFLKTPGALGLLARQAALRPQVPIVGAARPVFLASLIVERRLWGVNPEGYHLTNALIHGANSVLVWSAGLMFLPPPAAYISGLLFAVHPINTEAVDLASFRPDLLAALFMLLALLAYRRMEQAPSSARAAAALFGSALAYALGIFSKETALVFPAAALWFDLCFVERPWRTGLARRALALALFSALAIYYWHFRSPRSGYKSIAPTAPVSMSGSAAPKIKMPAPQRAILPSYAEVLNPSAPQWMALYRSRGLNFRSMCVIFADYFKLMAFPYPLRADRAPPLIYSWKDPRLKIAWGLLLAIFIIGLWAYAKGPSAGLRPLCWALGWSLIALAPASNVIRLYNPMAERYLYIPAIGACWIFGWIFARALAPWAKASRGPRQYAAALVLGALLVSWILMARRRNRDWRSDARLFGREAALGTKNARVYYNLGYLKQTQGDLSGAEKDYKTAIALNPRSVEALSNLAGLLDIQGRHQNALALYSEAAKFKPGNAIPYKGLGKGLERKNDLKGAEAAYRKALDENPDDIAARISLGGVLAKQGRLGEAANQYQDAARRSPENFSAVYRLASLLDDLGRREEAVKAWMAFLTLRPKNAQAMMNLGVVYDHAGKFAQAARWLRRSVALDPSNAAAYYNLGLAQEHFGRLPESEKSLKTALSLDANYLDAAYNLAVIEQKLGKIPDAISQYKKTLAINPAKLEALNNLGGLYQMQGDLAQAKKYLTLALKTSPEHPTGLLNNLGNVYLQSGDLPQAIAYYNESIARAEPADWSGNLAPTLTNLGICYYRQGRVSQAESAWKESIRKFPTYLAAYRWLAQAYRASGRDKEAQDLLRQAGQNPP